MAILTKILCSTRELLVVWSRWLQYRFLIKFYIGIGHFQQNFESYKIGQMPEFIHVLSKISENFQYGQHGTYGCYVVAKFESVIKIGLALFFQVLEKIST